jgi:hypothetical protein
MATFANVGRRDRALRVALGVALGITPIFITGHPNLRLGLGIAGALFILSGICAT